MINITIDIDHAKLKSLMALLGGEFPVKASPPPVEEPAKRGPKTKAAAPVIETPPPPPPVAIPSEKDVQDVVVALNGKFGIDKCIEALTKFNVKRARELKEDQREAFIAHVQELMK